MIKSRKRPAEHNSDEPKSFKFNGNKTNKTSEKVSSKISPTKRTKEVKPKSNLSSKTMDIRKPSKASGKFKGKENKVAPSKAKHFGKPKPKVPEKSMKVKPMNKNPENVGGKHTNHFAKPKSTMPGKTLKGKFTGKQSGKPNAKKFTIKFPAQPFGSGKLDRSVATAKKYGATGKTLASADGEKTDWRKFKQEKKELKLKRKQAKDSYEISVEAKQIYEKLKCRRTEKKSELVEKLYNVLNRGDVIKKLIKAHDTARIIQCMLKYASPSLRDQLSEKLLPLVVEMSISKYSHFCVLRMFKYGSPTIKSKLVDGFMGNVVRLAGHNIASKILDHAYHTVASQKQRSYLRQEFYGELYRSSKDENVKTLADTYKETLNMKRSILGAVKSNLDHLANKQLVDNSLVHAVILEYLAECEDDKIEETVSAFAPLVPLMLTTKDGTQAATICFYKSSPKNRRAIIKTIKEHLVKISTHEHGHAFLLALINSLDDTKATKKAIYDTLKPELETLMSNQWGRRIIEWLVAPGDTSCFHPSFIAFIETGLQYSKKDKEVRRKEIFEQIEESLCTAITEHPKFWLSNRHIGLVTAEILKKLSQQHFKKATIALADVIVDPEWTVMVEEEVGKPKGNKIVHDVEKIITDATKVKNQKRLASTTLDAENENESSDDETVETREHGQVDVVTISGIEESGLHIVLKKIIKNDKDRLEQNSGAQTFGSTILTKLSNNTLKNWINVNRACFILLNIFEQNADVTKLTLKELLKPLNGELKRGTAAGQKLLLEKLEL
ncbi:protein penguin [Eurosta solidaginis]|uniref:protein penguin n=1 Tax=Eurosta solidaginis TaxID=178769 RepID=UPI0035308BEE